ncbi:Nuclear Hormone Receptor family [Caenorhabditis elegans]|uniref:Nuclear Hormone Receptor family n=1 Tax=Caenorhabditis elegans TaxID=6239 RepID=O16676_CAEEL|nr:Nuclear Hormone Receptor family [Caenorhabditis elegans]CCD70993.1 Nuclear Hormone Receptor family [Caenorhabditis elegans]|eukprot:NP_503620.2 Nuclear Hormone Receptor family [Caenorhabditis elegans]
MLLSECEICGQPSHGNHFGVISCRACAAFFRRATLNSKKKLNLNCFHDNNSEINKNGFFSCKKCRLKKCLEKGMDASKFQLDRDKITNAIVPVNTPEIITPSINTFLGRPSFLTLCNPMDEDSPGPIRNIIDCNYLLDRATEILKNGSWQPYNPEMTSLEKISMGFENMRILKSSKLHYLTHMGKDQTMLIWEQEMLSTAEWLTNFQEFNSLPTNVQLEVIKSIWQTYGRFEKLARTAEFRRKKLFKNNNVFMVGDEACLDTENVEVDVSWFSDYTYEQVSYFMDCFHNEIFLQIVKEFEALNPTTTELNFMLLQVCLHHAGKKLQGDVATMTDYLEEVISNQLHHYYQEVRKLPNYSARLARMMKVNNLMRTDLRQKSEKAKLAMAFDVFKLQFSHPEMMC